MKVLILGDDGYIGYALKLQLLSHGHRVAGMDNLSRRARVEKIGSDSLTPIASVGKRAIMDNLYGVRKFSSSLGICSFKFLKRMLEEVEPDAIVHLAEQPSAPWSMISANHADETQRLNVMGTLSLLWAIKDVCPQVHLIKLGTMGEYGTPECDIPEGKIDGCLIGDVEGPCPMDRSLFPRAAGSFYHLSKVHDTHNIEFACRNWGLRSTDIMQGVVFGLNKTDSLDELTRFDYDEYFGTVINRFCVQAIIGHPLTIYGVGGQTRGFLPLKDSLQCLEIALNNPPEEGEYRTFNQFENVYSVNQLAELVSDASNELGISTELNHIANPRKESEQHYYNPSHRKLFDLGYKPTTDIGGEIIDLISTILPFRDRVIESVIMPKTKWS